LLVNIEFTVSSSSQLTKTASVKLNQFLMIFTLGSW